MEKKEAEEVLIDGKNSIFGGKIYSVSFKNNFSDSPSTLTVNVVNKEGSYSKPTLTVEELSEPYNVKIGELMESNFYLVKTRTSVSSGGKVLELTFWDASFYLDKIYIGLHKKHGIIPKELDSESNSTIKGFMQGKSDMLRIFDKEGGEELPPYYIQEDEDKEITPLIIMGREFHPCDTDLDGYLNFEEDLFQGDGCDPCPTCPEEKYNGILDRQRCLDLECSEIFEVRYTFQNLLDAVKEFFERSQIEIEIDEETIPETNEFYFADYEGPLRDVLKRWAADFAFNFYIEAEGEKFKLKFVDTKVPTDLINVEDIQNEDIISIEESESIESTENLASVSMYRQQGQRKTYNCQKTIKLNLRAVTLSDLFYDTDEAILGSKPEGGEDDRVSFEDLEISMALGKYSLGMRDQFWWGKMYGADGGREDIVKLQYLGPPDLDMGGSEESEASYEIKEKFPRTSLSDSGGISKSQGLDSLSPDSMVEIAQSRGILQLGSFKALAFIFPTGRNGEASEIYYNKGTQFGDGPGVKKDGSELILNHIRDNLKFEPAEEKFFSSTPLFGQSDFDLEDGTVSVESFGRGYFVLASRKEDLYQKILENESNLASNFIGKFFARQIDLTDEINLCYHDRDGKRNFSRSSISVRGGGEFYNFDDERTQKFLDNPLFSFGHSEDSKVGLIAKKIKNKKMKITFDGESPFDEGLVIKQASNNWFPSEISTNELRQFINMYESKRIKEIASIGSSSGTPSEKGGESDFVTGLIRQLAPEHLGDKNIKLFVVYPDEFSKGLDIVRSAINPLQSAGDLDVSHSKKDYGCYGGCDDESECFSGETDPARIDRLQKKYDELGDKDSELGRAILRELNGDVCNDGECIGSNGCKENLDCGEVVTVGNDSFSNYECIKGECIEKLGMQSPICTKISVSGFEIYAPAHGFEVPKKHIIVNENGFDARSYAIAIDYSKDEEVFIPKVEHIIQEDIEKFEKGYAKFNLNMYQVPMSDLNLFYNANRAVQSCTPSEELLEKLHEDFNKNLSYSIDEPRKTINISVAGISLDLDSKKIGFENGLESFSVNFSSSGVTSNYAFSNKIAQPISIDLSRRVTEVMQKRSQTYSNSRTPRSFGEGVAT